MQEKINRWIWISLPILVIGLIILYWIEKNEVKEFTRNLFYMDTYIYVKIEAKDEKKATEALEQVEQIYDSYHKLADRYQAYDGIVNLYTIYHNTDPDATLTIDERLYDMIAYGKEWYEKSHGKLDISMGNIIDVWNHYRTMQTGIPSQEELMLHDTGSIQDIILLDHNQIQNNHVNIDLGAIAKGYATEMAGNYLESIGITSYLINAGGNVKVGKPSHKDTYSIGIEDPNSTVGDVFKIIYGKNISVVTSGGYERYYEYEGKKYHHIIDPDTNMPSSYMKSVTVITEDSRLGDVLSTVLFLLPIEEGKALVDTLPVEAIWYDNNDVIITSKGIANYEQK